MIRTAPVTFVALLAFAAILALWWLLAVTVLSAGAAVPTPWAVLRQIGHDGWSFYGPSGVTSVAVTPRLVVNTTAAAVDAALDGFGLACILSYQAEPQTTTGSLQTVLVEYEPPPAPIHIVHPEGRHLPPKVRLFLDHAAEALRAKFGRG